MDSLSIIAHNETEDKQELLVKKLFGPGKSRYLGI